MNTSVTWIPTAAFWQNYADAFFVMDYWKSLLNTLIVPVLSGLMEVVSCGVVAYAFARFKFPERKILYPLLLLTILVPVRMTFLPSFVNYRNFDFFGLATLIGNLIGKDLSINLINTPFTFYLPSIFGVGFQSGLFIMIYIQFLKGIPKELEEAAWMDGAGPIKTFIRIIVPSSSVAILTVSILSVIWHWNEYYLMSLYFNDNQPLSVILSNIMHLISLKGGDTINSHNAYTYFHCYEYSTVGDDAKALPAGNFTVTMDVYALTEGTLAYKAIGLVGGDWVPRMDDYIFWSAGSQDLNKWVTATFSGSITDVAKIHELVYIAGFKGYVDNITVKSGNTEIFKLSFAESHLGKYGHNDDPSGLVVALREDIVEAKNIDAAIYHDNSEGTTNADTYLHCYDYSTYSDSAKSVPAGEYTVTMDVYTLSIGDLVYKPINVTNDIWSDADRQKTWKPESDDLNKWVTVTFSGVASSDAKLHTIIYCKGFKGYVDNITVKSGSTKIFSLGFAETDIGTKGHGSNPYGYVVQLKDEVLEAKKTPPVVKNKMFLFDTTAKAKETDFWFNELGMLPGYGSLPNGTYTVQFDVYPIVMPEGNDLFHFRTDDGNGPSSNTDFWKPDLTVGEWSTTSRTFTVKDGTKSGNHILFVYPGFKGCIDNVKILDANGNTVAGTFTTVDELTVPEKHKNCLEIVGEAPHVHKAGEAVRENVVGATCEAAGTYDMVVRCTGCNEVLSRETVSSKILAVDTTAKTSETAFWFNELGMPGYGTLPNGTYTVQFDVYPIQMPAEGPAFHFQSSKGSGDSAKAGFWKPDIALGEWSTTSSTFTKTDANFSGNHILFVYPGFKGYVDNIQILDSEGKVAAGTFTSIDGLTVPEGHINCLAITDKVAHKPGEAVRENVTAGSYDEVVYCTECEHELSRTPVITEITTEIKGTDVEVGSDLTANYVVTVKPEDIAGKTLEMKFTMNGVSDSVECDPAEIVDGTFTFAFEGIGAQCMSDTITAALVSKDSDGDETVLSTVEYSIKSYAQELLNDTNSSAELKTFVSDMLRYGDAAQIYRGHNLDNLATKDVTGLVAAAEKLPTEDDAMSLVKNTENALGNVCFKSATVRFSNINALVIKLNAVTDNTKLYVNDKLVELDGATFVTDGVYADKYADTFTFKLYEGDELIQTLVYSINAYTYAMKGSSNTDMASLACALYAYGASASDYAAYLSRS